MDTMCLPSITTSSSSSSSSSQPPQPPPQFISLNVVSGDLPTEDDLFFDATLILQQQQQQQQQHRYYDPEHLFQTLSDSFPDLDTCVEIRILTAQNRHDNNNNNNNNATSNRNNNNTTTIASSWKPLLQLVTNSFPHLISLSIIQTTTTTTTMFDDGGSRRHRRRCRHAAAAASSSSCLHVSTDLTQCILQDAPHLQHLSLQGIGLMVDTANCFPQLEQAVTSHKHLQHISLRDMYFCQTTTSASSSGRLRSDAWLFYSRLVQALCSKNASRSSTSSSGGGSSNDAESVDSLTSPTTTRHHWNRSHHHHHPAATSVATATATTTSCSSTLTHLTITTDTKYYVRPILTLAALNVALQHTSLQQLHLEHFNLWGGSSSGGGDDSGGGGSTWQCANSLRRQDCTLQTLRLKDCVFAGSTTTTTTEVAGSTVDDGGGIDGDGVAQDDGNGGNSSNHHHHHHNSILAGLQDNTSIQVLDLTGSLLHLEAAGLTAAVASNKTLQVLCLNGAKLGFELATHGEHLVRLLTAAALTDNNNSNKTMMNRSALKELHLQDLLWSDHYYSQQEQEAIVPLVLQTLLKTVQTNRNLTTVHFLNSSSKTTSAGQNDNLCDLIAEISLLVGLNRVKYWDFLQSSSSSCLDTWRTALSRIAQEVEEISIPVMFHMLRDHPLMMVCQRQHQHQQQHQS